MGDVYLSASQVEGLTTMATHRYKAMAMQLYVHVCVELLSPQVTVGVFFDEFSACEDSGAQPTRGVLIFSRFKCWCYWEVCEDSGDQPTHQTLTCEYGVLGPNPTFSKLVVDVTGPAR